MLRDGALWTSLNTENEITLVEDLENFPVVGKHQGEGKEGRRNVQNDGPVVTEGERK
jgi:hypothetical protein